MPEVKRKPGRPKKIKDPEMFFKFDRVGKTSTIEVSKLKGKRKYTKRKNAAQDKAALIGVKPDVAVGESITTGTQLRFTVKELVDIIKTCKDSKVSDFRYLGLSICFAPGLTAISDQPKTFSKTPEPQTQEQSQTPAGIQTWNQEAGRNSEEMARLQIEDPQEFEQAMIDGMSDPARENVLNERENS